MLIIRTLALLSLFGLSACGFKPVYSTGSGANAAAEIRAIAIAPTSNRTTQLVRNKLIEQFSNSGEAQSPRYFLTLVVREYDGSVLVRRSTDIQRSNLTVNVSYVLKTADKKTVLNKGRTVSAASYNRVSRSFGTIASSEFANISAQKDARKRAAIAVAEDINRRLAAYFATRP